MKDLWMMAWIYRYEYVREWRRLIAGTEKRYAWLMGRKLLCDYSAKYL